MDRGAISRLSEDESSIGKPGDLVKPSSSEGLKTSMDSGYEWISIGKRIRSRDSKKEPHHLGANPDDYAAAPSLINKASFKSKEPKAARVASSTPVVIGGEKCQICGDDDHNAVDCLFPVVIGVERCRICGNDHHRTADCLFLKYVPSGSTIGADYLVICGECGYELLQPTAKWCSMCGEWGGRAVEASTVDKFCRNRDKEFYKLVESESEDEDEDMDLDTKDCSWNYYQDSSDLEDDTVEQAERSW